MKNLTSWALTALSITLFVSLLLTKHQAVGGLLGIAVLLAVFVVYNFESLGRGLPARVKDGAVPVGRTFRVVEILSLEGHPYRHVLLEEVGKSRLYTLEVTDWCCRCKKGDNVLVSYIYRPGRKKSRPIKQVLLTSTQMLTALEKPEPIDFRSEEDILREKEASAG